MRFFTIVQNDSGFAVFGEGWDFLAVKPPESPNHLSRKNLSFRTERSEVKNLILFNYALSDNSDFDITV